MSADLRELFPTMDADAIAASVTTHVLDLAAAREIRRRQRGSDGRSTSEPITFRCPLDVKREILQVMHERDCTRNAAIVHLLYLGAKSRVTDANLPTPRELFKKPAVAHTEFSIERAAENERSERVQELVDIVMAPEPPAPGRGLFAL